MILGLVDVSDPAALSPWGNIELDDTAISEPKSLCINVFEEMQDEIL